MAASLFFEEEAGTFTGRLHPHNGYYAGDFSGRRHDARNRATQTFARSTFVLDSRPT
jgi:hypothetical protein